MNNETKASKYSFWDLITKFRVEIPIIQRDYAQGRIEHVLLCKNFLHAIKESLINEKELNLDFIYGSFPEGNKRELFQPLDGQQRLTTLFLLHWFAYKINELHDDNIRNTLLNFSYEIRISSREFCTALVSEDFAMNNNQTISEQIQNSNWFFLSWQQDSTIRAMLKMLDEIQATFKDVDNLWSLLTEKKLITFYHLILEDFGLSDDLYIKMNARGRLLTPFENLKAEIQAKNEKNEWEKDKAINERFSTKIDTDWTDFIWKNYQYNHSVDIAHMRFITTIVMINIALGKLELKPNQRNELIQQFEDNCFSRDLIDYIDENVFKMLVDYYNLYSLTDISKYDLHFEMWRHLPRKNITNEILIAGANPVIDNSSYTQKVLFFAQTEYMRKVQNFDTTKYSDWMRVVRNIISRGDVDQNGKRPDIVRSPETFVGVMNLINELSSGCEDIYKYLSQTNVKSVFARYQIQEEIIKAKILAFHPEQRELIFKLEDNDLLRGHISFALKCANFDDKEVDSIDFSILTDVAEVFATYFYGEKALNNDLRRAMLTIEEKGQYCFYNYWWSYWVVGVATKRKLFVQFREIEYFMNCELNGYLKSLILKLTKHTLKEIIDDFIPNNTIPNWQVRLIKEPDLLDKKCSSNYIAIPESNQFCYLLKSQRPRDIDGGLKIE